MLRRGPTDDDEAQLFVLSGVSGSEDLTDRLIARFSWARKSLILWLLFSLLLLGPWAGSFSSFSRSYLLK
jgi:hypothetical protein